MRTFLLILLYGLLCLFILPHSFHNLREGDYDTAYFALGALFFAGISISLFFPWKKGIRVREGFIRIFSAMIFSGLIVWTLLANYRIPDNRLYQAVIKEDLKKVEMVLNRYRIKDGSFYSTDTLTMGTLEDSLCKAVAKGDWPMVELFLEHGVDLNNYDKTSPFPLQEALFSRSPEIYSKLVSLGADIHYREGQQLVAALPWYSIFDSQMLNFLLDQGIDPDTPLITGDSTPKSPALHTLVAYLKRAENRDDFWEAIKILIAHGADINLIDQFGRVPYMNAQDDTTRAQLVELGAISIDWDSRGMTALHNRIGERDIQGMKDVLRTQPILLEIVDSQNIRPLCQICLNFNPEYQDKYLEMAEILLKAGADPTITDDYGKPLLLTLSWDRKEILPLVSLLIQYGADINAMNQGYTALRKAIDLNNPEAVQFLLEKEVQVDSSLLQFAKRGSFSPEINTVVINYYKESY